MGGPGSGRPVELTEEVKAHVVGAIIKGLSGEAATVALGFSDSTFHKWMQRGKRASKLEESELPSSEVIFLQFFRAVTEARAVDENRLLQIVNDAALEDYRAATWILERRYAKRWSKAQQLELKGKLQLDVDATKLAERMAGLAASETAGGAIDAIDCANPVAALEAGTPGGREGDSGSGGQEG